MKKIILSITAIILTLVAIAQPIRTSYFMDGATMRSALNPALRPNRGYVNIPAIGSIGIAYTSNSMSLDKMLYPNPSGSGLVTFLDESVDASKFISGLKNNNSMDTEMGVNLIGFGFYSGQSFWTFDVNIRANGNIGMPKGFFEFAKLGSGANGNEYNLKDMRIHINSFVDIGLGYSRPVNDKLTVGGKLKFLGGLADVDMKFDRMNIRMSEEQWLIDAQGSINASVSGIEPKTKIENGKEIIDLDELDIEPKGLGGKGFGVDLGATYRLLDNLTLSAAVIDLGFINWSAKNTIKGVSNAKYEFNGFDTTNPDGGATSLDDFDDITRFEKSDASSRSTSLRTTINIGGEYTILDNLLGFGLLSSTQIRSSVSYTELTAAATVRPNSWFTASLSYSIMHSGFNTMGLALNIHPSWINFFIGTDYMFFKVTPQYVPVNLVSSNFYFGLAIPLGKNPHRAQNSNR